MASQATPKPFLINVSDDKLNRLHQKLELTDLPDELDEAGWTFGAPLKDIKRLTEYWKDGFDWRKQEEKINEMPMFTVDVTVEDFGDLNIHFVHQKSQIEGAIPLLFLHGWPGSFLEVTKLLPLLKGGKDSPAFHIVAPSLPAFGFSSPVKKKGFGLRKHAEACNQLMLALGYDQYVVQGGDFGAVILRALAQNYPTHVKALHTNMVIANFPKPLVSPLRFLTAVARHALSGILPTYTPEESAMLARLMDWKDGSQRAYYAQMSTKPQTIGYSLTDSPVGLLAWIYEKLVAWTDDYPWTDDEILTWISIYYFSTAGPSAASFIYYESTKETADLLAFVDMPIGLAYFPKEVCSMPEAWAQGLGKIVRVSRADRGGHFAAVERPDAIAEDLHEMFKKDGPAFGVVKGKEGY